MKKILTLLAMLTLMKNLSGAASRPTKDLIVLLDYGQSEEIMRKGYTERSSVHDHTLNPLSKLGAMTCTLIPALYQKAAPILVSRSLLYSLLIRKQIFQDFITKDIIQLNRLYQGHPVTLASSLELFKQHCLYAKSMYETIHKELMEICKEGTAEERESASRTLASQHKYLESSAPRGLQKYSGESRSTKENLHQELQVYALCYYAPLSGEHYTMKQVSSDLILLLPRHYGSQEDLSFKPGTILSPLEKKLGLKVNHLKDTFPEHLLHETPITYGTPLAEHLKTICVTKTEGGSDVWALYLSGHGLPTYPDRRKIEHLTLLKNSYTAQLSAPSLKADERKSLSKRKTHMEQEILKAEQQLAQLPKTHERILCSITVDEFKKVLQFLNTELSTSLLLYTSCYGGGEHLVIPYQGDTQRLTFDCIAGSLSDALSFQTSPMLLLPPYRRIRSSSKTIIEGITQEAIDSKQKKLAPLSSLQFNEFFKKAREQRRDSFTLIHCLHPYMQDGELMPDTLENIALERPAGKATFSIIGEGPAISYASSPFLASTVDVALLTQARYGKLTLTDQAPSFISLSEGPAYHVIETLQAQAHSLEQITMSFLQLPSLSTPKVFWIQKLICKRETPPPFFLPLELIKSLIPDREKTEAVFYDVIIIRNIPTTESLKNDTSIGIYFSDARGTTWFLPIKKSWSRASKITKHLAYAELHTLFPGLREATSY